MRSSIRLQCSRDDQMIGIIGLGKKEGMSRRLMKCISKLMVTDVTMRAQMFGESYIDHRLTSNILSTSQTWWSIHLYDGCAEHGEHQWVTQFCSEGIYIDHIITLKADAGKNLIQYLDCGTSGGVYGLAGYCYGWWYRYCSIRLSYLPTLAQELVGTKNWSFQ